jgi:hypothetical protein
MNDEEGRGSLREEKGGKIQIWPRETTTDTLTSRDGTKEVERH